MIEHVELAGTKVVLKFHYGKRGSINPIISKTMGKVAVISHSYQKQMPQPGTFWLCEIEKEIRNQQGAGCYVVVPLNEIPLVEIRKLIPGAYTTEIKDKTVMCLPQVPGFHWIMPFSLKKFFIKKEKAKVQYEAVVVPVVI